MDRNSEMQLLGSTYDDRGHVCILGLVFVVERYVGNELNQVQQPKRDQHHQSKVSSCTHQRQKHLGNHLLAVFAQSFVICYEGEKLAHRIDGAAALCKKSSLAFWLLRILDRCCIWLGDGIFEDNGF